MIKDWFTRAQWRKGGIFVGLAGVIFLVGWLWGYFRAPSVLDSGSAPPKPAVAGPRTASPTKTGPAQPVSAPAATVALPTVTALATGTAKASPPAPQRTGTATLPAGLRLFQGTFEGGTVPAVHRAGGSEEQGQALSKLLKRCGASISAKMHFSLLVWQEETIPLAVRISGPQETRTLVRYRTARGREAFFSPDGSTAEFPLHDAAKPNQFFPAGQASAGRVRPGREKDRAKEIILEGNGGTPVIIPAAGRVIAIRWSAGQTFTVEVALDEKQSSKLEFRGLTNLGAGVRIRESLSGGAEVGRLGVAGQGPSRVAVVLHGDRPWSSLGREDGLPPREWAAFQQEITPYLRALGEAPAGDVKPAGKKAVHPKRGAARRPPAAKATRKTGPRPAIHHRDH